MQHNCLSCDIDLFYPTPYAAFPPIQVYLRNTGSDLMALCCGFALPWMVLCLYIYTPVYLPPVIHPRQHRSKESAPGEGWGRLCTWDGGGAAEWSGGGGYAVKRGYMA